MSIPNVPKGEPFGSALISFGIADKSATWTVLFDTFLVHLIFIFHIDRIDTAIRCQQKTSGSLCNFEN